MTCGLRFCGFYFSIFFSIGELDTLGDFGNLGKGMMGFDWRVAKRSDRAEDRIPCHLLSSMQIVRCLTWWRKADMAGECQIPLNAKDSRRVWKLASQRRTFDLNSQCIYTALASFHNCLPQHAFPKISALHALPNDLLRQLREILPALLLDNLPQIRLREHRQRIPRHILAATLSFAAAHEMRHSAQSSAGNQLQCQTSLEGEAVAWDVHLRGAAGAVADP